MPRPKPRGRRAAFMDQDLPNYFAGPYLERRAEAREDPEWLAAARADPDTIYLIGRGTAQLLHTGPPPRIAFLGHDAPLVRTEESGLLAYARALSIWRARHRHCGVCGAPTIATRAGHILSCTNTACAQELFPRLDPAIIVLVSDGERALLGRQPSWPPRRYSTIAGFVEPGESLEDAVIREVAEETGVAVTGVRYDWSQPWPFPSSLMIGFRARAAPGSGVRVR